MSPSGKRCAQSMTAQRDGDPRLALAHDRQVAGQWGVRATGHEVPTQPKRRVRGNPCQACPRPFLLCKCTVSLDICQTDVNAERGEAGSVRCVACYAPLTVLLCRSSKASARICRRWLPSTASRQDWGM